MSEIDIYGLGLHERHILKDGSMVERVPGGWIYTQFRLDARAMTSVFVPFNNEFQREESNT